MNDLESGAGVRETITKEVDAAGTPTPAPLDGEHWRQQGYALVMRYGSVRERLEAQNRLVDLEKIRERTRYFFEARRSEAA